MSSETDQPAVRIIDAFGGIRPMAAKLEIPVSTVQGWKQRDTVPAARMAAVLEAARANGIDIIADNFDGEQSVPSPSAASLAQSQISAADAPAMSDLSSRSASASGKPGSTGSVSTGSSRRQPPSRGRGVAILALIITLGAGGWVWWSTAGPGVLGGYNARLSALEGRITRLAEATPERGADSVALAELAEEVAALRTRLADTSSPDMHALLAPLRAEIEGLRDTRAARAEAIVGAPDPEISARLDVMGSEIQKAIGIASTNMQAMSGALVEFDEKLAALAVAGRKSNDQMASRIAALEAGRGAEQVALSRASALALAAGQLRTALERGTPFAEPLAIVDSLRDGNEESIAALDSVRVAAETGVATAVALELSFARLVPDLLAAERGTRSGDLVDRMMRRINDIVSIRRTGADVPGDGIEARIARAEILLAHDDVGGAVTELTPIAGSAGDLLTPWMSRARNHLEARDVLAEIEFRAIKRLNATGGM